jgi:hypothetical protein
MSTHQSSLVQRVKTSRTVEEWVRATKETFIVVQEELESNHQEEKRPILVGRPMKRLRDHLRGLSIL